MNVTFTLCSNNYFAQALALANSFLCHHPSALFYIILVDKKNEKINSNHVRLTILEIEEIEPDILELALKYKIVELNTAVKPQVFLYLFKHTKADNIYYLDPDIFVYAPFHDLDTLLESEQVLLTPHILTPIPIDGKTPFENDFLNYGLYNLGFLALKRSAKNFEMLDWWKERTYEFGYKNLSKGLFVDQLWMNFVPLMHDHVNIIQHPGYNMGPWNLHERKITVRHGLYYVNGEYQLFFYHFSTLNPMQEIRLHPVFDRFNFTNRNDLKKLYYDYAEELVKLGFAEYNNLPCFYVEWRHQQVLNKEKEAYNLLPLKNKLSRKIKNAVPEKIRKAILGFIQA